jgi:hypothetical protein
MIIRINHWIFKAKAHGPINPPDFGNLQALQVKFTNMLEYFYRKGIFLSKTYDHLGV